jgi:hypothetical protein
MKTFLHLVMRCVFAVALIPFAASAAGLKEDMIALDRAYIPALSITNRNPQSADTKLAMDTMNVQWASFKRKYAASQGGDKQWQPDMAKIDGFIVAANRIVDSGKDFVKAHEELEGVRLTFLEMRQRAKMPYYLDDLTRFHDPMEEMYLVAKGKTGEQLSDADVAKIKGFFPEAEKLWSVVLKAQVDPAFLLTDAQREQQAKLMESESRMLDALKQGLAANDRAAIAKSAQGIRQPFSQLYVSFGDFSPFQKK